MQEVHCSTEIRTEAGQHNLRGQILESIMLHVHGKTYVHKPNVYSHVKAGELHDWATKNSKWTGSWSMNIS